MVVLILCSCIMGTPIVGAQESSGNSPGAGNAAGSPLPTKGVTSKVSSADAPATAGATSEEIGAPSADLAANSKAFSSSCREVRSVPIKVTQLMPNALDIDNVRRSGIRRAGELAIEQVVGLKIISRSEAETTYRNEELNDSFLDQKSASSEGLVTYKLNSEEITKFNGTDALKLDLLVTVCVPKTEEQLAEEEKEKQRKLNPPERVISETPQFFNTATGEPMLWYWKSPDGEFEFFDNSGFHPVTGDPLYPVTRLIAADWSRTVEARAERLRRQQEEELNARSSGERCDQLAANPYDLQRPQGLPGVEYDFVKVNASEAIGACQKAIELYPTTTRYYYQLGRAWQSKDLPKAQKYLKRASGEGYVVAYDNLGWLLIRSKKTAEGRQMFSRGADMGDPSCMYSLASLLEKDARKKNSASDFERAVTLFQKAASLGHGAAARHIEELVAEEQEAQRRMAETTERNRAKRQQDEEAMRLFLGLMGGILQRR
jgi:hypothetical protein